MSLADGGQPEEQDILGLGEDAAGSELEEALAVDRWLERKVELVEGRFRVCLRVA